MLNEGRGEGLINFHPQKAWGNSAGNLLERLKNLEISGSTWKHMATGGGFFRETAAKHKKSQ